MHLNHFLSVAVFVLAVGQAESAPLIPETADLREPLMRALNGNDEVVVYLKGEIAERIRLQTKAPADTRVKAKVTTAHVIRQGCKRLHIELSEPSHKMKTVNGTEEPFLMWYEMNICTDGKPPQLSVVGMTEEEVRQRKAGGVTFGKVESKGNVR